MTDISKAYQISDRKGDKIVVHYSKNGIFIRGDFSHRGCANWPLCTRALPYAYEGKINNKQFKALQNLQLLGWNISIEKEACVNKILKTFIETSLPTW